MKNLLLLLVLLAFAVNSHSKEFIGKNFSATFGKTHKSLVGKSGGIKSRGAIEYSYPSKLKIDQTAPVDSLLITNGKKTWFYSKPFDPKLEKGEVVVEESSKNLLAGFFDALRKGLVNNKAYSVKKVGKQKEVHYELTFSKAYEKLFNLSKVHLFPKVPKVQTIRDIDKLVIFQSNGAKSEYRFLKFNEGVRFSKGYFDFKIPKGTNVTTR